MLMAIRFLSLGLVPLTVAPFIGGSLSPILDATLCTTLLLHCHIGFDACITDYFPKWQVPGLYNVMVWLLRAATVLTGVGLYEFETSELSRPTMVWRLTAADDIGLTGAIAKIWKA
jgi:succinate dehydrogenase (ubiquinone) membrane anchor subunit